MPFVGQLTLSSRLRSIFVCADLLTLIAAVVELLYTGTGGGVLLCCFSSYKHNSLSAPVLSAIVVAFKM